MREIPENFTLLLSTSNKDFAIAVFSELLELNIDAEIQFYSEYQNEKRIFFICTETKAIQSLLLASLKRSKKFPEYLNGEVK